MRLRFGGACAAVVLLVGGVFVSGSSSATASGAEDGLWYIDAFHVRDAWNAGFTGEGVTIAVIDSPINLSIPALAGADIRVQEPSLCFDQTSGEPFPATSTELTGPTNANHGTNVTAMIVGNGQGYNGEPGPVGVAPGATVLYYAVTVVPSDPGDSTIECRDRPGEPDKGDRTDRAVGEAIDDAVSNGADIISVSLVLFSAESDAIARAHRAGVVIVGGVPNPGSIGTGSWPGSANGVVAVNGIDPEAKLLTDRVGFENVRKWTTVAGPGKSIFNQGYEGEWSKLELAEGTSLATPIVAGFLAVVLQKYPDATGNQLIQTLIHNTGGSGHVLTRGPVGFGYGIASLTSMLEVDPTQYEDVNPLLTEDGSPTLEEINGSASPSAAPDDEDYNAPDSNAVAVWSGLGFVVLFVVIGVGVVLLVGGVIIFLVVRRSRRTRAETK